MKSTWWSNIIANALSPIALAVCSLSLVGALIGVDGGEWPPQGKGGTNCPPNPECSEYFPGTPPAVSVHGYGVTEYEGAEGKPEYHVKRAFCCPNDIGILSDDEAAERLGIWGEGWDLDTGWLWQYVKDAETGQCALIVTAVNDNCYGGRMKVSWTGTVNFSQTGSYTLVATFENIENEGPYEENRSVGPEGEQLDICPAAKDPDVSRTVNVEIEAYQRLGRTSYRKRPPSVDISGTRHGNGYESRKPPAPPPGEATWPVIVTETWRIGADYSPNANDKCTAIAEFTTSGSLIASSAANAIRKIVDPGSTPDSAKTTLSADVSWNGGSIFNLQGVCDASVITPTTISLTVGGNGLTIPVQWANNGISEVAQFEDGPRIVNLATPEFPNNRQEHVAGEPLTVGPHGMSSALVYPYVTLSGKDTTQASGQIKLSVNINENELKFTPKPCD